MTKKLNENLIERQYHEKKIHAQNFINVLVEQIIHLLSTDNIVLGVPLESRVKSLDSINEKIKRKSYLIENITDISDLIGIRLILLFRSDLDHVEKLLMNNFAIKSAEDTSSRLFESQFGYQSRHYILAAPDTWKAVPTYGQFESMEFEVQVRTLAQHVWAAAEHKLQYKEKQGIPASLRRNIYRISALLEIVDIEFDRIREERERYIDNDIPKLSDKELLNVDIISSLLSQLLPVQNRDDDEPFGDLIMDLDSKKIRTIGDLKNLINNNIEKVMDHDRVMAEDAINSQSRSQKDKLRAARGFFFTHTGLVRTAMRFDKRKAIE